MSSARENRKSFRQLRDGFRGEIGGVVFKESSRRPGKRFTSQLQSEGWRWYQARYFRDREVAGFHSLRHPDRCESDGHMFGNAINREVILVIDSMGYRSRGLLAKIAEYRGVVEIGTNRQDTSEQADAAGELFAIAAIANEPESKFLTARKACQERVPCGKQKVFGDR